MKNTQPIRGYHHLSRAWYAGANMEVMKRHEPNFIDEVTFGFFYEDGGTSGEMTMKWTMLGGKPTPQLQVFDDAWAVLADFKDLVAELGKLDKSGGAHRRNVPSITPAEFCALLDSLGFKDLTATKNPH